LTGNFRARRRLTLTKKLLEYLGVESSRVRASWVSASEAIKFVQVVEDATREVKEAGPNRLFIENESETR
jgi:F420-non-reducing hydrogenase iron-sulfur subunit